MGFRVSKLQASDASRFQSVISGKEKDRNKQRAKMSLTETSGSAIQSSQTINAKDTSLTPLKAGLLRLEVITEEDKVYEISPSNSEFISNR
jgi:hypothetical protein